MIIANPYPVKSMPLPAPPVTTGRQVNPCSLISRVAAMHLGECISHIHHIDYGTVKLLEMDATRNRDGIRDSVNSSVRLAARKTGSKYAIEVSHVLPPSGRVFILAIITRTE